MSLLIRDILLTSFLRLFWLFDVLVVWLKRLDMSVIENELR